MGRLRRCLFLDLFYSFIFLAAKFVKKAHW
jgi:hypothetical protein